jgi:hypothetical protein
LQVLAAIDEQRGAGDGRRFQQEAYGARHVLRPTALGADGLLGRRSAFGWERWAGARCGRRGPRSAPRTPPGDGDGGGRRLLAFGSPPAELVASLGLSLRPPLARSGEGWGVGKGNAAPTSRVVGDCLADRRKNRANLLPTSSLPPAKGAVIGAPRRGARPLRPPETTNRQVYEPASDRCRPTETP